jgi:excisionase family DNA binding protein
MSQEHVRREIRRERLRAIRVGDRAWRVPESALVEYVGFASAE